MLMSFNAVYREQQTLSGGEDLRNIWSEIDSKWLTDHINMNEIYTWLHEGTGWRYMYVPLCLYLHV